MPACAVNFVSDLIFLDRLIELVLVVNLKVAEGSVTLQRTVDCTADSPVEDAGAGLEGNIKSAMFKCVDQRHHGAVGNDAIARGSAEKVIMQHVIMCREKMTLLDAAGRELLPSLQGTDPQIGIEPPSAIGHDDIQAEQIGAFRRMADLAKDLGNFLAVMIVEPFRGGLAIEDRKPGSEQFLMVPDIVPDFFRWVTIPVHVKMRGDRVRTGDIFPAPEADRRVPQGQFQIKSVYFLSGMKYFKSISDEIKALSDFPILPCDLDAPNVIGERR